MCEEYIGSHDAFVFAPPLNSKVVYVVLFVFANSRLDCVAFGLHPKSYWGW